MKSKTLITDIENKKDKNGQDYWIIPTKLNEQRKDYFAFTGDYNLAPPTASLLANYPHQLVNSICWLTIEQKGEKEKVIAIELTK
jgi:hypothetical protein